MHDRDIVVGCDDSVIRKAVLSPELKVLGGTIDTQDSGFRTQDFHFIRRARGYTPRAIKLPKAGRSVLACGGCSRTLSA